MRRKSGWVRECEGEGGRENLRLDGVSPAHPLTFALWEPKTERTNSYIFINPVWSSC
jgi:hypothetical protein